MTHLAVKNWAEFQHYKDRDPVWIKLYLNLLDHYEFGQLTDGERGQLVMIWLLAAKSGGFLPNDSKWIASRINATGKFRLQRFLDTGFLVLAEPEQGASKSLAEPYQSAALEERRGETEERRGDATTTACARFAASVPVEYRADVEALFRASQNPGSLAASLEMIVNGGTPPAYDHATIGRALQEMRANSVRFGINALRAYCRNTGGNPVPRGTAKPDGLDMKRWVEEVEEAA